MMGSFDGKGYFDEFVHEAWRLDKVNDFYMISVKECLKYSFQKYLKSSGSIAFSFQRI